MAHDIWEVAFDRSLGAQVPALGFSGLGKAAGEALLEEEDWSRSLHFEKTLFHCRPSGYIAEGEARAFRRALSETLDAHPDGAKAGEIRTALRAEGVDLAADGWGTVDS